MTRFFMIMWAVKLKNNNQTMIQLSTLYDFDLRSYFDTAERNSLTLSKRFLFPQAAPAGCSRDDTLLLRSFLNSFITYHNLSKGPPTVILRSILEDSKLYRLQTRNKLKFPEIVNLF